MWAVSPIPGPVLVNMQYLPYLGKEHVQNVSGVGSTGSSRRPPETAVPSGIATGTHVQANK